MLQINLIVSDVDGVWTDGGVYYSDQGELLKKFNFRDGGGIVFSKLANIPVLILSGENSNSVSKRFEKLGVNNLHLGIRNKYEYLLSYCANNKINISSVAFIGDDINDLRLIESCGFTACPSDASIFIKNVCKNILKSKGGEGAFREFVELLLDRQGILKDTLDKYYQTLT